MGRLSGYRYREVVKRLRTLGLQYDRPGGGSHEIWYNPATNRFTVIPNHAGDMPEGTLRSILKQAGIDPEDFLAL